MSENSAIEWTDHTWSPVWGCQQISPACDNCYAMTLAHRFGTGWNGAPYREFGDHHWNEPVRWNRRAAAAGRRPRVFPSMCDPLDKDWPAGVRERFWRLVDATPYLTWLILTKRVGNVDRLGPAAALGRWPANVWLGSTVVTQEEADRDIPKLLATPARVRFLSIEPMLGPIDLEQAGAIGVGCDDLEPYAERRWPEVDWIISGGESGSAARPAHPDWFRGLRDQCAAAGIAYLHKQNGEFSPVSISFSEFLKPKKSREGERLVNPRGVLGGFPETGTDALQVMRRVGKKAAGRMLDEVEHNEFPGGGNA